MPIVAMHTLAQFRVDWASFLTDLSLTLVYSLKTLASEHVNLRCRKICLKTKT